MKTKIKTKFSDAQYNEYNKGETGQIDGYCRGADNRPYAMVFIGDRLCMIPPHHIELIAIGQ